MLNFRVSGEGKTIVFLHGFLESMAMWEYLPLHELKARCIFIDLPGHGKSKLTDKSNKPSIDFIADEVICVLNHLNVTNFSIIGHSMGAYVGLIVKQKMVNCKLLVFLNSNFWCDNEQKKNDRLRVVKVVLKQKKRFITEAIPNLFGNPKLHKDAIAKLVTEANKIAAKTIVYSTLAMRNRKDFSKEIHLNPSQFPLIHGELDTIVTCSDIKSKVISKQQLHIISNGGHMLHIERTAELMSVLMSII